MIPSPFFFTIYTLFYDFFHYVLQLFLRLYYLYDLFLRFLFRLSSSLIEGWCPVFLCTCMFHFCVVFVVSSFIRLILVWFWFWIFWFCLLLEGFALGLCFSSVVCVYNMLIGLFLFCMCYGMFLVFFFFMHVCWNSLVVRYIYTDYLEVVVNWKNWINMRN